MFPFNEDQLSYLTVDFFSIFPDISEELNPRFEEILLFLKFEFPSAVKSKLLFDSLLMFL